MLEEQAKVAAAEFRSAHGLGTQPLGDLVALVEQTTGFDVAVLDAQTDEHGLTMRDPVRNRVFVGIARSRNPMRQRSTLAHELGHLIFEEWAENLAARSPAEIRADAFARHLLAPVSGVKGFLGSTEEATEQTLSEVVQHFLVSPAIAAIALREAGFISPQQARAWAAFTTPQLATRFGWKDQYETLQYDSNRLRAPQRLLTRAITGYEAGVISAQAIATLRGAPVAIVSAELAEIGLSPHQLDEPDIDAADLPNVNVDLSLLEGENGAM